jgi:hypothetical protein
MYPRVNEVKRLISQVFLAQDWYVEAELRACAGT